ncbi:hypothetical protein [Mesorhizobium marinum]|uniref:hypothetical protein n=1 Tax=Mesorhizobium marinum TaxID=3228790 RepID=UPI0034668DA9
MNAVFACLWRFAVILVGYAVASLAASAFLNVVMLAWFGLAPEETRDVAAGSLVFTIPFVALFVAYFGFLPALPAIVLAELLGKRDWLFHALAGGAVSVVVIAFSRTAGETGYADVADLNLALVVVGAGMCGGIGYWLVAGRSAGLWRAGAGVTSPAP